MKPFAAGVWPDVLATIEGVTHDAVRDGKGTLLIVQGDPGLGQVRLVADALSRLSRRRPRAEILAGSFDIAGARGDFAARPLSRASIDVEEALTALGHTLTFTGAAIAVADPTGVLKASAAIAALFGAASAGPD